MPHPRPGESQKDFMGRCMGSAEARGSFPDASQRAAVCHSFWRRKKVHKAACCALCAKQDIPEVQAVIRLVNKPIQRELRDIAIQVIADLFERLDDYSDDLGAADVDALVQAGRDRPEVLAAILASLLKVVEEHYGALVSGKLRRQVDYSIDALFDFGAADVGFPFEGPRVDYLRAAALAQLDLMTRQTVTKGLPEVRGLIQTYLTVRSARQSRPALLEAAQDTGISREALIARLERLLVPQTAVEASVDAWAYLWSGISSTEAAFAGGVRAFQAVAVVDKDTTKFCRWVNGRIIPLARAKPQIDAIARNALAGDAAELEALWPFIDPEIARSGNELQFEKFFRRVGLPPYHFRCRTRPRPITV